MNLETVDAVEILDTVANRFEWRVEEAERSLAREGEPGARDGRIRLGLTTANGTAVELHVRDEGPGFPPEFLEHAFERFTRPQRGRQGSGSGLGLSIVRAVAEAHGGRAQAANSHGGGADVWLVLPLHKCGATDARPGASRR